MTYRSLLLLVCFPLCKELPQQNRGGLFFLSLHGSLATSCFWKISNTDWLSIISWLHQPTVQMMFPLHKSHKILYEIRNLPLDVVQKRKQGFILFGCGTLHTTARILIIQWRKEAPQKHRCFSTISLWNLAQASAKLKLLVLTPTKNKIKYKSFY